MSGQEWAPGTVAVATVDGAPNVRVVYVPSTATHYVWLAIGHGWVRGWQRTADLTDVRPLVVLDVGDYPASDYVSALEQAQDLCYRGGPIHSGLAALRRQIEAQTRPPKPPEPTRFGAIVRDSTGILWFRWTGAIGGAGDWWHRRGVYQGRKAYGDIDAVEVLSEGVA